MNRHIPGLLAIGLILSFGVAGVLIGDVAEEAPPSNESNEELPLDELRTFADVFGRIKNDYVEGVDDRELIENAIRGMLAGLDPHSSYLDADEYRELKVGTSGEFGGLGIEVGMEDGFVKVIAPIDDTPAYRAGLKSGDLILRIDDKPVKGLTLSEAVDLMRGKRGTKITLTLLRGEGKPFKVDIVRDIIRFKSVKRRLLEPGYGYVRVSHFQARTAEDLVDAITALEKENEGPLDGLVLDLRNNPGGVLNSAVGVSDLFLSEGLIVYTRGRMDESELKFEAGPDDRLEGAPIVVLVNGGSASASEIVAGALQDHRRAIVMGTTTFGKGSVQTIVPIDDETALKLTTARYYTPSGRAIQAQGIEPDIVLQRGQLEVAEEPEVDPLKEANLLRHLDDDAENVGEDVPEPAEEGAESDEPEGTDEGAGVGEPEEGDPAGDEEGGAMDKGDEPEAPLAVADYQLSQALNLLKGINILGKAKASGGHAVAPDHEEVTE